MKKQFKQEKNQEIRAFLCTEKLCTDEFSPLVNRGEFVFLDPDAKAKEGDLVAVKCPEYPGFKLAFYDNKLAYWAVSAGVGRTLNRNIF
jgi:uncharacterized protein YlaI